MKNILFHNLEIENEVHAARLLSRVKERGILYIQILLTIKSMMKKTERHNNFLDSEPVFYN